MISYSFNFTKKNSRCKCQFKKGLIQPINFLLIIFFHVTGRIFIITNNNNNNNKTVHKLF
jgi:hypothetical protein